MLTVIFWWTVFSIVVEITLILTGNWFASDTDVEGTDLVENADVAGTNVEKLLDL